MLEWRVVGTLIVPASNESTPAALLINGSGPLDRDSNMPGQALDIANSLAFRPRRARRGVASVRQERGRRSNGDYLTTSFDRETSDAASTLPALRRVPAIDPRRVTLIGHSVGATIAIRLARAHDWVAGAVLLCASRSPGAEVMRIQSDRIAASLRGIQRLGVRRFLRRQEEARHALLASNGDVIDIEGGLPARWFREYMAYDPALDLAAIRCPVLAITGRSDLHVDPDDVERIGALVAGDSSAAFRTT